VELVPVSLNNSCGLKEELRFAELVGENITLLE